jgi:hypothetical protein
MSPKAKLRLHYARLRFAARSGYTPNSSEGVKVYEPQFRRSVMNPQERSQLVRKAKADRLAFDAAQHLSRGEASQAAILGGECIALAGPEQWTHWLRHYATTKFKVAGGAVEEFLSSVPPADLAV